MQRIICLKRIICHPTENLTDDPRHFGSDQSAGLADSIRIVTLIVINNKKVHSRHLKMRELFFYYCSLCKRDSLLSIYYDLKKSSINGLIKLPDLHS